MIQIAVYSLDRAYARELRLQLVGWGYRPWLLQPGPPLHEQLFTRGADLLMLDMGGTPPDPIPLRELQRHPELKSIPVLVLLGNDGLPDLDFTAGIEDFCIKSLHFDELKARLKLMLWKVCRLDRRDTVRAGALVMNLAAYQAWVHGRQLDLTFKEFELLRFLMTHRGRVFSRDALLRHVWGDEYLGGTRTVDVHIRRLRGKIGPDFDTLIQTVRNVGYKMVDEKI